MGTVLGGLGGWIVDDSIDASANPDYREDTDL